MSNQHETPCHICGAQTYMWGVVEGSERHKFTPDERTITDKLLGAGIYGVRARTCINCGNVQLFVRE